MATVGYAKTMGYWIAAGGSAVSAPIAAAITFPESGNVASTVQQGQPYATTGWGLWQITPGDSEPQCGTDEALLEPAANACAAVAKWKAAGGFTPWTTYTGGEYKAYLQSGVTPVAPSGTSATASSGASGTASATDTYGIGAFGQGVASAITGAAGQAESLGLGVALALLGAAVLAVALWLGLGQTAAGRAVESSIRSGVKNAGRAALVAL